MFAPASPSRPPALIAGRSKFTGRPTAPLLLAMLLTLPALAHATEADWVASQEKASQSFLDQAQGGITTHQAQIRARQKRLAKASSRDVPRFQNQLQLKDRASSIPLTVASSPQPGYARLLNSAPGKTNVYVRGTLYSINNSSGLGLTTPDTMIGSDQQVNEDVAIGFAAGRISTRKASGTLLSAYLSLQPLPAVLVDMSVSLGAHRARHEFLKGYTAPGLGISGHSQALSLEINRAPQNLLGWTFSPYSRYDLVATQLDSDSLQGQGLRSNRQLSSLSFGSIMETDWFGFLGSIQPRLQLELRHQITEGTGSIRQRYKTHGMIGLGLTSRLSRDMATFAESRYAAESGSASPESLVMLGIRLFF